MPCAPFPVLAFALKGRQEDGLALRQFQGPAGSAIYTPWLKNSTLSASVRSFWLKKTKKQNKKNHPKTIPCL